VTGSRKVIMSSSAGHFFIVAQLQKSVPACREWRSTCDLWSVEMIAGDSFKNILFKRVNHIN
jgi:hypothetical protein